MQPRPVRFDAVQAGADAMKHVIQFLWQLPVALPIWLLYILPAWGLGLIRYHGPALGPIVALVFTLRQDAPRWWLRLWDGWGGHALPCAVVVRTVRPRLLPHELRHARSWAALGPLFPVAYLLRLVEFGYEDHPDEVDARAGE